MAQHKTEQDRQSYRYEDLACKIESGDDDGDDHKIIEGHPRRNNHSVLLNQDANGTRNAMDADNMHL
jgi:hypothetical protein